MLGICLPACLPLCCSEGGRGWACSCLGRAVPAWDTVPVSGHRFFIPHSSQQSMWGIGPASPVWEDCGCLILQVE